MITSIDQLNPESYSEIGPGCFEFYSPSCTGYPCRPCMSCWCDCPCHGMPEDDERPDLSAMFDECRR